MVTSDSQQNFLENQNFQTSEQRAKETFAAFERFSRYFCQVFTQPELLDGAECRQSFKDYIPRFYSRLFGTDIDPLSPRHVKWYRRLAPLWTLPRNFRILDFGGGYGMDTIFLASLGYEVFFYEISLHHIGAARWFVERFSEKFGPLAVHFVLAGKDPDPHDLDAIFVNEVAHHVEPAQRVFDTAAAMLRPGGHLFLLESNFFCPVTQAFYLKIRGFHTVETRVNQETGEEYQWGNEHIRPIVAWNRLARIAGFCPNGADFIIPWFLRRPTPSRLRLGLEHLPLARNVLAPCVTLDYLKQ